MPYLVGVDMVTREKTCPYISGSIGKVRTFRTVTGPVLLIQALQLGHSVAQYFLLFSGVIATKLSR